MADGILDGISSAVGGVGDFFLNRGRYADPNAINPQFGVPEADVRQAGINTLANVSALLLAAGQPMSGSERAKLLAGIGPALGGMQTDIYKASQARLMTAQQRTAMEEARGLARLSQKMKDNPQEIADLLGTDVRNVLNMTPSNIMEIMKRRETEDPQARQLRGLQIQQTQRALSAPERVEAGGVLYERQNGEWKAVTPARPQGGLDERAQQLIIAAQRNPAIAETPEYAMAFNQSFGPKMVQGFNPETKQMEYQWVSPPLPPGVIQPRTQGAPEVAPGAVSSGAPAGIAAPPPGGAAPVIARPPTEEKPLTETQSKATGFAARMLAASKIIDPLDATDAARPGFIETVIGPKIGETATNLVRGADRQRYRQAQENWVRANLRQESGAVIGGEEMQKEIENYFPRPGDAPEVVVQKRKAREEATKAMIVTAGPGAQRAGLSFKPYEMSRRDEIRSMPEGELLQLDVSSLNAAEKAEYLVRLRKLNGGR
jgi:hypothetical protein